MINFYKKLFFVLMIFIGLHFASSAKASESFTVLTPVDGVSASIGDNLNISWSTTINQSDIIMQKISFQDAYGQSYTNALPDNHHFTMVPAGTNNYNWKIPSDANGLMEIELYSSYYDSEQNVAIYSKKVKINVSQNASITFQEPKSGAIYNFNDNIPVNYEYSGSGNDATLPKKFYLYRGDDLMEDDIYISGSNKFWIQKSHLSGDNYRIKVRIGSTEAFSPYFTIKYPAIDEVNVNLDNTKSYIIGSNYDITWSSNCKGGVATIWFSTTPEASTEGQIIFPLSNFQSAKNLLGTDAFYTYQNAFMFNTLANTMLSPNLEKINWSVPEQMSFSNYSFNNQLTNSYYIFRRPNNEYVIAEKSKNPVILTVTPGQYVVRVDIKGANGCFATGQSQIINVAAKGSQDAPKIVIPTKITTPIKSDVDKNSYDYSFSKKQAGKILLQVESRGEAWYVNPKDGRRQYMADGATAYSILRSYGVGITNKDLNKILVATDFIDNLANLDSDNDGYNDKQELQNGYNPYASGKLVIDKSFSNIHKGKIFLQVESHGEAWYINPIDGLRYYLGGASDAFNVMRSLGLGITNTNLNKIPINN